MSYNPRDFGGNLAQAFGQGFTPAFQQGLGLAKKRRAYQSLADILEDDSKSHQQKQSSLFRTLGEDPEALSFGLKALGNAPVSVPRQLESSAKALKSLIPKEEWESLGGEKGASHALQQIHDYATANEEKHGGDFGRALAEGHRLYASGKLRPESYEQEGPHEGTVPQSYRAARATGGEHQFENRTYEADNALPEPQEKRTSWQEDAYGGHPLMHLLGGAGEGAGKALQNHRFAGMPLLAMAQPNVAQQFAKEATVPNFYNEIEKASGKFAGEAKTAEEKAARNLGSLAVQALPFAGSGLAAVPVQTGIATGLEMAGVDRDTAQTFSMLLPVVFHAGKGAISKSLQKSAMEAADDIQKMSSKTGESSQDIINRVRAKAREKGWDLGNPKELTRSVRDITEEHPGLGVELEAGKKPHAISEQIESQKLKERPVEEALKYEKEYGEEARAKKASTPLTDYQVEISKRSQEQLLKVREQLSKAEKRLAQLEKSASKPSTSELSNSKILLESSKESVMNLRDEVKALESSVKSGNAPRKTRAFYRTEGERRVAEHREAAKNPDTTASQAWLQKMEKTLPDLEKAAQSAQRGDLPYQAWETHVTRIKDAYAAAYEPLIAQLKSELASAKVPHGKSIHAERASMERLLHNLERNQAINRAQKEIHVEKLKTAAALRGAKGKLLRQALSKDLKDVKDLQKRFINDKQAVSLVEQKSQQQGLKLLKDAKTEAQSTRATAKLFGVTEEQADKIKTASEKLAREASKEAEAAISKETGIPKEEVHEAGKEFREFTKKSEQAGGSDTKSSWDHIKGLYERWENLNPGVKKIIKYIVVAYFGTDILTGRGLISATKRQFHQWGVNSDRDKYKDLKTAQERTNFIRRLKSEGSKPKDIKYIMGK